MSDFPPSGPGGFAGAGSLGPSGASGPRADFGLRLVAYLIDAIIIGVIALILAMILGGTGQLLSYAVLVAYFTYWEGTPSGQSPGKKVMNIRVIDFQTGGSLGHSKALIRQVMRLVSLFACFLGCLWMLWDKEKQTWHDKVAASVVVPTSAYPVEKWPG